MKRSTSGGFESPYEKRRYDLDVNAGSSPAQSTNLSDSYQRMEGQTCGTSWTRKFRSSDYRERPINDVWCNGSTTDFGSVSGGSSPPGTTESVGRLSFQSSDAFRFTQLFGLY